MIIYFKANTQQKEIEKKECKKCKNQNQIDYIYCTECGERYDAENNQNGFFLFFILYKKSFHNQFSFVR
jgi:hypothetical protein